MSRCEDCGCILSRGRCANCHEELVIFDQYLEQDMSPPPRGSDFMKKVGEQRLAVTKNLKKEREDPDVQA